MSEAIGPWGFPAGPHARLLVACGVSEPEPWRHAWERRLEACPPQGPGHPSVLWGLTLPLLERCAHPGGDRLLLGVNGPVGAGKTTLGRALRQLAAGLGLRLAVVSIDDAYLPWPERRRVLQGNPFGVDRVPPGSHDVPLLLERLAHWRSGGVLELPRFDKRLRGGAGDRCGWERLEADVLVLEGWLLGCRSLGPALEGRIAELGGRQALGLTEAEASWLVERWDGALAGYQPLWAELDGLWLIRPTDWRWPRRWRFQAEARQRRGGGAALGSAALEFLVNSSLRSLPPVLYQEPLWREVTHGDGGGPAGGIRWPEAVVLLDGRRRCRWSGTGRDAATQLSLSSAASSIG